MSTRVFTPFAPRRRLLAINWARFAATFLLTVTVLGVIANIVLWAGQRFQPPPVSFIRGQSVFVAEMFYSVSYAAMGCLLATRLTRNPLGWLFLILGTSMALQLSVTFFVQEGHQAFRQLSDPVLIAAWLASSVHLPMLVVLTTIVFLCFPTGKPLTPRWRGAGWLTFVGAVFLALGIGLDPTRLIWYPSLTNIFAAPFTWRPLLTLSTIIGLLMIVSGVLLATVSMVLRYRRAEAVERAQLRWIAGAVVLIAAAGLPFIIARYGLQTDYSSGAILLTVALLAGCLLPVAAAYAVLRHRLYDIDLILRRAFVYIPLSAILGGLYAAGVAFSQRIFQTLTGDKSDAAVIITTLVLVALFTPIKDGLQRFVDGRFKPMAAPGIGPMEDIGVTLEERVALLEQQIALMQVTRQDESTQEID